MEWLIAAGIIGAAWYAAHQTVKSSPGGSTPPGSSPPAGSPPAGAPPPGSPPPVAGPGVYPPNTPGAFPVVIGVIGGSNFGQITASPGGQSKSSATVWYGPGTPVVFTAQVVGAREDTLFTAFDHWAGTGGESRQPVVSTKISGPGYIDAVFATFGIVGA